MRKPRPNVYDPNAELRHKLMKLALKPQPEPMNLADKMAHDLQTGDKIAKIALGIIASAAIAFVWVAL